MARVVALVPDLFFSSKIEATLAAAGHEVVVASSPEAVHTPDLLIVDLHAESFDPVADTDPGVSRLGFYSHVDAETKQKAEAAGFDLVVPRSRMAREMVELVGKLVG